MKFKTILILCFVINSFMVNSQCLTVTNSPAQGSSGIVYYDPCILFRSSYNSNINYLHEKFSTWEFYSPSVSISSTSGTFSAKGFNSSSHGNFYLSSSPCNLEVDPILGEQVEKYDLFEVGFSDKQIPNVNERINNFFQGIYGPSCELLQDYIEKFQEGIIINPYDPDHISVEGQFFSPGTSIPIIKFGFFYREYEKDIQQDKWNEISATDNWRIRFSPNIEGTWSYRVVVKIAGKIVAKSCLKEFQVGMSSSLGYVRVNNYPSYWTFSNSSDKLFPVGNNIAWTNDYGSKPSNQEDLINGIDLIAGPYNDQANSTRLMFAANHFSIEWEKLNNYDTRQQHMYILDNYIKHLKAKGMYTTLAFLCQDEYNVFDEDWQAEADWRYNPYNPIHFSQNNKSDPNSLYKGIQGISTAKDFYTNEDAKKFLKKKLRYIDARWGYSTNVMMYEIQSEMDGTLLFKEAEDDQSFDEATRIAKLWFEDMASYLKNDLKCNQLTSFSFGPTPRWRKSSLLLSNYVDALLIHFYLSRDAVGHLFTEDIMFPLNTFLKQYNKMKPIMVQECGNIDFMDNIDLCTDIQYHKFMWSCNTGGSSGLLYWPFKYILRDNIDNPLYPPGSHLQISSGKYESEYFSNLTGLRKFFNDNYNRTKYYTNKSEFVPSPDLPIYENTYSISDEKDLIIGWITNRSSNIFNCDTCISKSYLKSKTNTMIATYISDIWDFECTLEPKDRPYIFQKEWPVLFDYKDQNGLPMIKCESDPQLPTLFLPGDYSYNKAFGPDSGPLNAYPTQSEIENRYIGNKSRGLGLSNISIIVGSGHSKYNIQWYCTWTNTYAGMIAGNPFNPDPLLFPGLNPSAINHDIYANNGVLNFDVPPTILFNQTKYPGDWAYVIRAVETNKSSSKFDYDSSHILKPEVLQNPVSGELKLIGIDKGTPFSIKIINSQGVIMKQYFNLQNTEFDQDMKEFKPGVYFLLFKSKDIEERYKVVKI